MTNRLATHLHRTLGAAAALTGFVIMAFELVAVRCLAPYYGSSIVVWTSILGTIITSLALGSFIGGRLADRAPEPSMIGRLLVGGAATVLAVAFFHTPALALLERWTPHPVWGALIASAFLFIAPATLLAAVFPFVIRLSLTDVSGSGALAGRVSALSSIGSIGGTFAAGFVLIPALGTTSVLALLASVTAAAGVFLLKGWWRMVGGAILAMGFWQALYPGTPSGVVLDLDTLYSRAWVMDHREPGTERSIRSVFLDPFAWQGGVYRKDDRRDRLPIERALEEPSLVVPYTRSFRLAARFAPTARRILILGGGILSVPREFLRLFPEAAIDVVELDSAMTRLAETHFGFQPDSRIRFHHVDARVFLNRTSERYDIVIVDVFTSALSIPFHIATVEAVQKLHERCAPGGIVFTNLIGVPTGAGARFIPREAATYGRVFKHVEALPLLPKREVDRFQNVILVSSDKPLEWGSLPPDLAMYKEQRRTLGESAAVPVFTDDFAPVEYLSTIGWTGRSDTARLRPPLVNRGEISD